MGVNHYKCNRCRDTGFLVRRAFHELFGPPAEYDYAQLCDPGCPAADEIAEARKLRATQAIVKQINRERKPSQFRKGE